MVIWRPHYHYAPQSNWMSDPNGLVWHNGLWHLYYQYNPYGDEWGHMSWGHATSEDLVHWQEKPVAIRENDRHMIFSGSAVTGPDGRIMAAYTGAVCGAVEHQAQFLVVSNNGGTSFAEAGAPAIDEGRPDLRDPKLFWHAPSERWIMLLVRANESCAVLYGSRDLVSWDYLSQIGPFNLPGDVWECPDLIELAVEDGGKRWLFKVDILQVDPAHLGSGAIALCGIFDGAIFTPDTDERDSPHWQWVDHGRDFYAAVGWNNVPRGDDGYYWIGWMGNHRYQKYLPFTGWRGAMSLARRLSLRPKNNIYQLIQQPVVPKGFGKACVSMRTLNLMAGAQMMLGKDLPRALCVRICIEAGIGDLIMDAGGGRLILHFDQPAQTIAFDRSACGYLHDNEDFGRQMTAKWMDSARPVEIWIDDHSIEIFADDGATVITAQTFLAKGALALCVVAQDICRLSQIEAHEIYLEEGYVHDVIAVNHG